MRQEKRSETLSFRLPHSTSQHLETISGMCGVTKATMLCRLIEQEARRLLRRRRQPHSRSSDQR